MIKRQNHKILDVCHLDIENIAGIVTQILLGYENITELHMNAGKGTIEFTTIQVIDNGRI